MLTCNMKLLAERSQNILRSWINPSIYFLYIGVIHVISTLKHKIETKLGKILIIPFSGLCYLYTCVTI